MASKILSRLTGNFSIPFFLFQIQSINFLTTYKYDPLVFDVILKSVYDRIPAAAAGINMTHRPVPR